MPRPVDIAACDQVLRALQEGRTLRDACDEAHVAPGAVLARADQSRRFRRRLEAVPRTALALVEDALYRTALNGNVPALTLYLCNRSPDRWRPTSALKAEPDIPVETVTAAELIDRYRREDNAGALPRQAS